MNWVLLPGMDGTGDLLAPFAAELRPNDVCVVARYPKSKRQNRHELLRHIREYLPAFEDFIIVAESFSGQFAIEISAGKPARLQALILVNTFARRPINPFQKVVGLAFGQLLFQMPAPKWAIRRYLVGPAPYKEVEAVRNSISSVDQSVLASRFRMVSKCDVRPLLGSVRARTLVLSGNQDRLVNRSQSDEIVAGIPDAKLEKIDAPHLALFVRPKDTLKTIQDFLGT